MYICFMKYNVYQVDAFANQVFSGNPACVIPLKKWLSDSILLKIAQENAVSETAFFIDNGDDFHLRWFTPDQEIDLCGHATLASAYTYFNFINPGSTELEVHSIKNGSLKVILENDLNIYLK